MLTGELPTVRFKAALRFVLNKNVGFELLVLFGALFSSFLVTAFLFHDKHRQEPLKQGFGAGSFFWSNVPKPVLAFFLSQR